LHSHGAQGDGSQQIDGYPRGLKVGIIDDAFNASAEQPADVVARK
jgi:hypothetical protein